MKYLRFESGVLSLWRFRFACAFTTALWGGESKSGRTTFWHVFKFDLTKEEDGFYLVTVVALPLSVWVGYKARKGIES